MGPYMSSPITTKEVISDISNEYLTFSVVSMQGWRSNMEDSFIAQLNVNNEDIHIFGVFDGHGGQEVAQYVSQNLVSTLIELNSFKEKNYELALKELYIQLDKKMQSEEGINSLNNMKQKHYEEEDEYLQNSQINSFAGCTANIALIHKRYLYVANAGDSRSVLCSKGKAIEMSIDHKPEDQKEKERIIKAGGYIINGRINGKLNLSRALGDFDFKKGDNNKEFLVSCIPEVWKKKISEKNDQFLLIACDGIWECLSSQEIISYCEEKMQKEKMLKDILIGLFDKIISKDNQSPIGCDNMTAILIKFN